MGCDVEGEGLRLTLVVVGEGEQALGDLPDVVVVQAGDPARRAHDPGDVQQGQARGAELRLDRVCLRKKLKKIQ